MQKMLPSHICRVELVFERVSFTVSNIISIFNMHHRNHNQKKHTISFEKPLAPVYLIPCI